MSSTHTHTHAHSLVPLQGKLKGIIGVPTSVKTHDLAKRLGIHLATLDPTHIHIAIVSVIL